MFFNFLKSIAAQKMVLVVRTDIKMTSGKIASQCAHAAVALYQSASKTRRVPWILSGQPKIVLKVDRNSEFILKDIYKEAKCSKINACLIYDAGRTQIESGTLTVLGLGPHDVPEIDKLTKHFKLL